MAVYDEKKGFDRAIHNIENSPFRTKFDRDVAELEGNLGIGCISDNEPQPLLVRSHLGNFAITTVGKINNMDELIAHSFKNGSTHFLEMSGGSVNPTEMVASLINQKGNMIEGIRYAQDMIEGSMTMLILTPKGLIAARDTHNFLSSSFIPRLQMFQLSVSQFPVFHYKSRNTSCLLRST